MNRSLSFTASRKRKERYPFKAALDGALASGMEHGMRETMEQLEALIASQQGLR